MAFTFHKATFSLNTTVSYEHIKLATILLLQYFLNSDILKSEFNAKGG